MFKLNESVYDEVAIELEKNLNKFASNNVTKNDKKLIEALELLNKSAETLELFGFDKEANIITKLITVASLNKQADEKDKVYFTLEDMKNKFPKEYQSLPENLKNKLAVMYFIDPDFTEGSHYTIMALEGGAKSYAYNTEKQSWDEIEYPLKSFAAKKKKSIKDPHTSGLTSEKMLSNLKNKGIMFNADDQNMAHDRKFYKLHEEDGGEYYGFEAESLNEAKLIAQYETNRNKAPLTLTPGDIKFSPKDDDKNAEMPYKLPSQEHGYPLIYLTENDNVLCPECATEVKKEGKKVIPHIFQEGHTQHCEICSAPIESAYGDPENPDDNNEAKDHKLKYFPEAIHGIPVIYLEKGDQDYNAFCPECAQKLQNQGKNIYGHVYEEGPNRECKMCNKELESAMGQEQYYKDNADEIDNHQTKDHKSHEGPDEYKREKLEDQYLDEVLHDDYDHLVKELDEIDGEDQVFI